MIHKQSWPGLTRYLITREAPEGSASVQLELFDQPQKFSAQQCTAFLWSLWVDKPLRRKGIAASLMQAAENIAAANGHNAIFLEWSIKEGVRVGASGIAYHAMDLGIYAIAPQGVYAALIDRISGKGVWDSNPYVFVYDFELVK